METPVAAPQSSAQWHSAGGSCAEIHAAVLAAAEPRPDLAWLDVGCGTGVLLRRISRDHAPRQLVGVDIIDWLDADLRRDVEMVTGPAESALAEAGAADRVMMIETIEHLEAPWSVVRHAARLVSPGGCIVVSTPNIATLRHRLELGVRGQLTSFRPDNQPHLGPALPHVTARILREEGLDVGAPRFAAIDVVPWTRGRPWPRRLHHRWPRLSSVSVIVIGNRPA